jgi:hypothetical protein
VLTDSESAPAGWYPDPEQPASQRYWDGTEWTEQRAPAANPPPPTTAPPSLADGASKEADEDRFNIPLFGARGKAKQLAQEVETLRAQLDKTGALSLLEIEQRRAAVEADITEKTTAFERDRAEVSAQLEALRESIVITEEAAVLQEIGIYEYRHPLSDSVAYQSELKRLSDEIKAMTRKDGGAVSANTDWRVNNSLSEGRRMVRDFSKLMLRAYNAEADNLVRGLKPYKLETAIDRLTKVAATIVKLGRTMDIRISDLYHGLRVRELELTADYLEKVAEEKEREREEKARLREERKAQLEMELERARLDKERQHYENALAALEAKGDAEGAARLREDLEKVQRAINDVDYRAANIRAGYVYVISNLGSFGDRMVKIGMTRRLDPLDRVRELSDASVPFKFDVHALFFSKDAVGIETELHQRLANRRVNRVNLRREFFYATPEEVKTHLMQVAPGDLLQYEETSEALEYHQSRNADGGSSGLVAAAPADPVVTVDSSS